MPPKKTWPSLTFASSVRVGVYTGRSRTSWPRSSSSRASALSRRQLPQYMPPAPAVMWRSRTSGGAREPLQGPPHVEVLEEVALVRLVPAHLPRGQRAEVQPVQVRRGEDP